ncbi:ROK family protein [Phaeacidiphilus oryzae]|jgi:glucokinase|uniref:ROK family protein n=1 Tax=Phaeacidiphilus oryzae TaxID=348818 RepID=UPI00056B0C03|nr:ROK family protein [Phaeacidiphilus oryzae]
MNSGVLEAGPVIGLDLGGTKIAGALVAPGGRVLARDRRPTPADAGPRAVLDALADSARALAAGVVPAPRAIGVAAAGLIDPEAGVVRSATAIIAGWAGTAVAAELARRAGLPVACDNDVRAAACAELEAGPSGSTLLQLSVGTGIGGAIAYRGRLLTGRQGVAGHLGHLPSPEAAGLLCSCGAVGHLEAVASGPGMAAAYARSAGAGGRPPALEEVVRRAEGGDRAAAGAVELGARAAGRALGGLANAIGPDRVVVGGGVPGIGKRYWSALRAGFAAELLPPLADLVPQPPAHGADAPLLGAALLTARLPLHRADPEGVLG